MLCWHPALRNTALCRCKHPANICQLQEAGHSNQAWHLIQLNIILPITTYWLHTFLKYHATSERYASVAGFGWFGAGFFSAGTEANHNNLWSENSDISAQSIHALIHLKN